MSKRLTAVMVGIVLLSTGSALFAAGEGEEDTYRVGAAVYGLQAEYMRLWADALEEHPMVENGTVDLTVFDGDYDAGVQINQFETMASQGYDGILFVPIDVSAGAAAVEIADAQGIPVVGSNTRVESDLLTSYIGSDDVLAGRLEAEAVIEEIGGSGNVVIIEGPIGQSAQIDRREGNMEALDENPDVELLEMQTANWSRSEALDLMEDWLTAYPDEIDGVIGQNDEMALGAIEAIEQAGLDIDDFATAGIDGVTDALEAVKEVGHTSILQDATGQAQGALDILLRELIGEEYEPQAEFWEEVDWGDSIQDNYNVPWVPVTEDNVDDLLEQRQE